MIAKFINMFSVVSAAAIALTGCGSTTTLGMASEESVAKIRELVTAHVDTTVNKIYEVAWYEDSGERKLENILSSIEISYIDPENDDYDLTIRLQDGDFVADEPRKSNRKINSYECSVPLDPAGIDAAYVRRITEAAALMVDAQEDGAEYELKSIGKYRFRVEPVHLSLADRWQRNEACRKEHGQLVVRFELNYVKPDEKPQFQGRYTTMNYYTIAFTADEAGAVDFSE